ncbi:hypothetical protein [Mesorhizobium sp. B1-1-7]|uniref:hypothetical protein n=1 Tax=Mesorhizobium sp. B1-1-7 TaxID=2589977 RepID=UPI00112A6BC6|nr:hypothetical protein [Mesorhizobium sp. B1-1-7]TPN44884.1 hypothetical protein FJ978_28300 [Mesorhizobium sp. B1-1-7]
MKRAHVAIESVALAHCRNAGECRCSLRMHPPSRRINRRLCEAKYQAVVRTVIDRLLWRDGRP